MKVIIILLLITAAFPIFLGGRKKNCTVSTGKMIDKEKKKALVNETQENYKVECPAAPVFGNKRIEEFYNNHVNGRIYFHRQNHIVLIGLLKELKTLRNEEVDKIIDSIEAAVGELKNGIYIRKAILVLLSEGLKKSARAEEAGAGA